MNSKNNARAKPRTLAVDLVEKLTKEIKNSQWQEGHRLPTEAAIMSSFGVSRTVVREAISRLQAEGLVETKQGVGSFLRVPDKPTTFRVRPDRLSTLLEVISLLEFRIAIETEAAALAAQRSEPENHQEMFESLIDFRSSVESGTDSVEADFQFHRAIARATRNPHFVELLGSLGAAVIPRRRLPDHAGAGNEQHAYLKRVDLEHESIFNAIVAGDPEAARAAMRTHLSNSRDRLKQGEENSR